MSQEHATVDSSAHNSLALALQPIKIHLRALAYFKTAIALLNTCSNNRTLRAKRLNVLIFRSENIFVVLSVYYLVLLNRFRCFTLTYLLHLTIFLWVLVFPKFL